MGYNTGKRDFRVSTGGFEQPQEPGRSRECSGRVCRRQLYGLRDRLEVASREKVRERGKVRAYAVLGAIAVFLVWWFPGQAKLSLPQAPFDLVLIGTFAVFLAAVLATWWRRRVAVLRIGISGTKEPITVRLVAASKAESVFKALKG